MTPVILDIAQTATEQFGYGCCSII